MTYLTVEEHSIIRTAAADKYAITDRLMNGV